jgi:hypothetical protein
MPDVNVKLENGGNVKAQAFSVMIKIKNAKRILPARRGWHIFIFSQMQGFNMSATLYNIPVNEKLIWDYKFESQDYQTERFYKWYLARVLDNGTARDVTQIPFKIIFEEGRQL